MKDDGKVVGKVKMTLKKFDGEYTEGKEPVETIETEEPLSRADAVALGLIKGEDNGTD